MAGQRSAVLAAVLVAAALAGCIAKAQDYYVVTSTQEPWTCVPASFVCSPQRPPVGPAAHDVGDWQLAGSFVGALLTDQMTYGAEQERWFYDATSGAVQPAPA